LDTRFNTFSYAIWVAIIFRSVANIVLTVRGLQKLFCDGDASDTIWKVADVFGMSDSVCKPGSREEKRGMSSQIFGAEDSESEERSLELVG